MKELFSARSTNGRWGLALVGPEGTTLPAEGSLRHVGSVAGINTYELVPGETSTWVLVAEDVKVHGGATLVALEGLQSGRHASIVLLGAEAVVEHYGYMRRGSRIAAYVKGVKTDIPGSVLAAMGLIEAQGEIVEVAPPPKLEGALAAAFAKLHAA